MSQEDEARRAARLAGLRAYKSQSSNNFGGFLIFDPKRNRIVAGEKFNLTADDVVEFCADYKLQYLLLAVEEELEKADDVIAQFEQIVSRVSAFVIPAAGPHREKFTHHFRIATQPLVDLELKRRAGEGVVEDDFWRSRK